MEARQSRAHDALVEAIAPFLETDAPIPSITEVCTAAGVSRPTFYQHFGDVPTLIAAAGMTRLQELFDEVSPAAGEFDWHTAAPRVIHDLIARLFADAAYYARVLEASGTHAFQERVVQFLADRMLTMTPLGTAGGDEKHLKRTAVFLAAGATWLVVLWVRMGEQRPAVAAAADEVSQLVSTSIIAQTRGAASASAHQ